MHKRTLKWPSADGPIKLKNMTLSHVENAYNFLNRKRCLSQEDLFWKVLFRKELEYREGLARTCRASDLLPMQGKGGYPMVRIGRLVIDEAAVVKTVSDGKKGTTTLYALGANGLVQIASFKKHAAAAWKHFKGLAD